MLRDFKPKFTIEFDYTFFLHLIRESIVTSLIYLVGSLLFGSVLSIFLAVGFSLGVDTAWEWQDGLHNDGFNVVDFIAGLIGIGVGVWLCRLV